MYDEMNNYEYEEKEYTMPENDPVWETQAQEKTTKRKKKRTARKAATIAAITILCGTVIGGGYFAKKSFSNSLDQAVVTEESVAETAHTGRGKAGLPFSSESGLTGSETEDILSSSDDADADAGTSETIKSTDSAARIGSTADTNDKSSLTKASREDAQELSVADIAENTMPAMVAITNTSVQRVQNYFSGQSQDYESISKGTGVIVGQNDTEILIATNAHVVSGAQTISVTFIDETTVEGYTKGSDSENDLAVVAVPISSLSEETLSEIKFVEIGDSDEIRVGEQVVAIGNALGYGQSVSSGYLSAKDRGVSTEDGETMGLLQTDAAINPGNSGGALLNMQGQLIGINSAKYADTQVEGMGFAIPINKAAPILETMMNKTTRVKASSENAAYFGIKCYSVSDEAAQYYHIPTGVYVQEVTSGSAAEKAGMIQGDIITAIDGETVASDTDLTNLLSYYAAGDTAEITIARAGAGGQYSTETLTITFDGRPNAA